MLTMMIFSFSGIIATAQIFAYYAGIILYALPYLLIFKLHWCNGHKPAFSCRQIILQKKCEAVVCNVNLGDNDL